MFSGEGQAGPLRTSLIDGARLDLWLAECKADEGQRIEDDVWRKLYDRLLKPHRPRRARLRILRARATPALTVAHTRAASASNGAFS